MKKKYYMIMGLCILAVFAGVFSYVSATGKNDPLQPQIAEKILSQFAEIFPRGAERHHGVIGPGEKVLGHCYRCIKLW